MVQSWEEGTCMLHNIVDGDKHTSMKDSKGNL